MLHSFIFTHNMHLPPNMDISTHTTHYVRILRQNMDTCLCLLGCVHTAESSILTSNLVTVAKDVFLFVNVLMHLLGIYCVQLFMFILNVSCFIPMINSDLDVYLFCISFSLFYNNNFHILIFCVTLYFLYFIYFFPSCFYFSLPMCQCVSRPSHTRHDQPVMHTYTHFLRFLSPLRRVGINFIIFFTLDCTYKATYNCGRSYSAHAYCRNTVRRRV